jgi:hypothetical protein
MEARTMSGSRTIAEDDGLLDNVHPGAILREDFLIGSDVPLEEVATGRESPANGWKPCSPVLLRLMRIRTPARAISA